MKHQGDVVRRHRTPSGSVSERKPLGLQGEASGARFRRGVQGQDRRPKPGRDLDRRRRAPRLDDQGLGLQVGQIELELLGPIAGIERRRGDGRGHRDEGYSHLRPVRQHDGHPVARRQADGLQGLDRRRCLLPQAAIEQVGRRRSGNRPGAIVTRGQELDQGRGLRHDGFPIGSAGVGFNAGLGDVRRHRTRSWRAGW